MVELPPEEINRIVNEYGKALKNFDSVSFFSLAPQFLLPCPKEKLKLAIKTAILLQHAKSDAKAIESLMASYVAVSGFISDTDFRKIKGFDKATPKLKAVMKQMENESKSLFAEIKSFVDGLNSTK